MAKLFGELKRRNVVRVAIAYVVVGWVTLQVGDVLFDIFEAPVWVGKTFAALLLLGFPFACLFAWAYEMTPEGVKKTAEVDQSDSLKHSTGRKLDFIVIGALIVALGYFIWDRQDVDEQNLGTSTTVDRSIAVLPFVNMSSDEEQEWFADGLTEEILNSLARTPDLLVASRTSSFQYKGQNVDISDIANALGVAHILEGSVRRGGDRLRVTAQLIRASDGFHLWSETFDREPSDVIEIQENVAIEIANALETAMNPDALKKMVSAGTASVAAYEAYLEGLVYEGRSSSTGDPEDWLAAFGAFERATSIDKSFGAAYFHQVKYLKAQMGVTDVSSNQSELPPKELFARFAATATAAINHAPDEGRAILYRSAKADGEMRFRDALRLAKDYIELYPNDVFAYTAMTDAASAMRDAETVLRYYPQLKRIIGDDPLELHTLLNDLLFVGLPDQAAELARVALPRYPQHGFITYQSHRILLWVGAVAEAKRWIPAIRGSEFPEENKWIVELRQACAEGDHETAKELAQDLIDVDSGDPGDDASLDFLAHAIMGDTETAHQVLVDLDLDIQAQRSFLGYPYFNHNYFPELAEILTQQGVDRPFLAEGPPYRCKK